MATSQGFTAISRLARTIFPFLTARMDCRCVLEKQPGKADY